ncbi:unnamed protein product, partial [Symbiodinium pilosum]
VFVEALNKRAAELPPVEEEEITHDPGLPPDGSVDSSSKPMDLFDFCEESPSFTKQAPPMVTVHSTKSTAPEKSSSPDRSFDPQQLDNDPLLFGWHQRLAKGWRDLGLYGGCGPCRPVSRPCWNRMGQRDDMPRSKQ